MLFAIAIAVGACGDDDGDDIDGDGGVTPDAGGGAGDSGLSPDAAAPECGAIATFEDGRQPTAILHVAEDGNDGTGDGSAGNPFATIEGAVGDATPGTAIRLHAGTYAGSQFVLDLRGTEVAPIWIGGAPGEPKPVLSGGGEGLHLSRVSYLVVHDLEVTGAANNGINCDDGGEYDNPLATHHVVFRDLFIHDIGGGGNQDCLKLSGVYDYFVLDSEMTACGGGGSGSAVDHVGCHRGLLAGNDWHDLSGNAVQNKGGSADIEIRANRMINAGERALNMGGSTGLVFFRPSLSTTEPNAEARRISAIANVIEGSVSPIAFVGCVDCLAANNTIINPGNWILRILQETTSDGTYEFEACRDNRFVNNLVYFDRGAISTYVNIGPDTAPGTFTFSNNLWYAHDDPGQSQPSLPVTETGGVVGVDPGLDTGYRIEASSPAAGAGTAVAGVDADFDTRCYANQPSIGAFEVE